MNQCPHPLVIEGRCASCRRPVTVAPVLASLDHRPALWPGLVETFEVTATARGLVVEAMHVCPCGSCLELTELDELTDSLCPSCHAARKALA